MSKASRSRRRRKGLLPPGQKCIAHTRTGDPCKNSPMLGSVVCRMHGGSAPQVRAKAAERFAMEQDRAAQAEIEMAHDPSVPAPTRLAALKDVLDRGGTVRRQEVEINAAPWQAAIEGILVDTDDELAVPEAIEGVVIEGEVVSEGFDDEGLPALVDDPPHGTSQQARLRH